MSDADPMNSGSAANTCRVKGIAKRPARRQRERPLPPHVTARNLAIEKQRRENLNDKLLEMARLLPALASTKRLSKRLIITEGVHHLRKRRNLCICASRDVRRLIAENHRLVSEIHTMRSQMVGVAPVVRPLEMKRVTEALETLMSVEEEPSGEFPEGFGVNLGSFPSIDHNDEAMGPPSGDIRGPRPPGSHAAHKQPPYDSGPPHYLNFPYTQLSHAWSSQEHAINRDILGNAANCAEGYNFLSSANGTDSVTGSLSDNMVNPSARNSVLYEASLGATTLPLDRGFEATGTLHLRPTDLYLWPEVVASGTAAIGDLSVN